MNLCKTLSEKHVVKRSLVRCEVRRRLVVKVHLKGNVSIEVESGAVLASSNTVLNFELHKMEVYLFSSSRISFLLLGNTVIFNGLKSLTKLN